MSAGDRNPQCWRSECRVECYYPAGCTEPQPTANVVSAGGSEGLRAGDFFDRERARVTIVPVLRDHTCWHSPSLVDELTDTVAALLAAQSGPEVVGDGEVEALREAVGHLIGLQREAREALESVKDRLDEHAYDELATALHDEPYDHEGEPYSTPAEPRGDAAGLEAVLAGERERIALAIEAIAAEHKAEDEAEGCDSRYCAGWLLGQQHAARIARTAPDVAADPTPTPSATATLEGAQIEETTEAATEGDA